MPGVKNIIGSVTFFAEKKKPKKAVQLVRKLQLKKCQPTLKTELQVPSP